jgi:sec-independent protein translocase protein TatC
MAVSDDMAVADDGLGPEIRPDLGLTGRKNPDARMPLMEHIRELRNRVIKIALVVTAGSIAGWFVYYPVFDFIKRPYCKAQPASAVASALAKSAGQIGAHCDLYYTGLFDPLVLRLQISIAVGVIISSPIWLYQVWAFIAPGLYRRERRWAYYFVGAALPLFAIGATIAYFVMTRGIEFLMHVAPPDTTALITINTYLSYAGMMLTIFGIAFELPLVVVLLNLAGVLTHARFRKWRRVIIFLVFAFAAVFTPSPDPLSMLALALPCVVLIEVAEVFAWVHDRRKARLGSLAFPGLTDEEVAKYGLDKPLGEETRPPK